MPTFLVRLAIVSSYRTIVDRKSVRSEKENDCFILNDLAFCTNKTQKQKQEHHFFFCAVLAAVRRVVNGAICTSSNVNVG